MYTGGGHYINGEWMVEVRFLIVKEGNSNKQEMKDRMYVVALNESLRHRYELIINYIDG